MICKEGVDSCDCDWTMIDNVNLHCFKKALSGGVLPVSGVLADDEVGKQNQIKSNILRSNRNILQS